MGTSENQYKHTGIISPKLKAKIDLLHKEIGNIEWSGAVFYNLIEGNPIDGMKVEFVDMVLLDIGTHTYTENSIDKTLADYILANPELILSHVGAMHTHHTMGASLSDTDMNDVMTNAKVDNHYLSLVVDTSDTPVCVVTYREEVKDALVKVECTIPTYEGKSVTKDKELIVSHSNIEKGYFNLSLSPPIQLSEEEVSFILDKIEGIKESKKPKSYVLSPSLFPEVYGTSRYGTEDKYYTEEEDFHRWRNGYKTIHEDEDDTSGMVKYAVCVLISCNPMVTPSSNYRRLLWDTHAKILTNKYFDSYTTQALLEMVISQIEMRYEQGEAVAIIEKIYNQLTSLSAYKHEWIENTIQLLEDYLYGKCY